MSLVTITGNAWDGDLDPIAAENEPELFFRPLATSMARGLMTDREIPTKTFDVSTGAFTVDLESQPGLMYIPILRWLKNPESPNNRARGQAEWEPFFPWTSGPIDEQPSGGPRWDLWWVALTPPPPNFRGYWLVSDPTVTPDDTDPSIGDVRRVY